MQTEAAGCPNGLSPFKVRSADGLVAIVRKRKGPSMAAKFPSPWGDTLDGNV